MNPRVDHPAESDPDTRAPLVSVIVVTMPGRSGCLPRLLASLRSQTYPNLETIVVDNGVQPPISLDGHPGRVIRNASNPGMCHARNQGCARARGKFVAFFDDDAELIDPGAVAAAVRFAGNYPKVGAIGFAQLTADGAMRGDQPGRSNSVCRTEKFYGYGCLLRRKAFLEAGGFNVLFNYYYEEHELSLRLTELGYDIVYMPHVRVIHHQDSRGRDWTKIQRLLTRNLLICAIQRHPWYLAPFSACRIVKNFLAGAQRRAGGDWRGFWWILGQLARMSGRILADRKSVRLGTLLEHSRLRRSGGERIENAPAALAPAYAASRS